MKHPTLTLTRSKQLGVLCWAIILLGDLAVFRFPVRDLPAPVTVVLMVLLVAVALTVVVTSLGLWTEPADERAMDNARRADAALFTLFFLVMAGLILFTLFAGEDVRLTLGWGELLMVFSAVCLVRDALFLGYERFGR